MTEEELQLVKKEMKSTLEEANTLEKASQISSQPTVEEIRRAFDLLGSIKPYEKLEKLKGEIKRTNISTNIQSLINDSMNTAYRLGQIDTGVSTKQVLYYGRLAEVAFPQKKK